MQRRTRSTWRENDQDVVRRTRIPRSAGTRTRGCDPRTRCPPVPPPARTSARAPMAAERPPSLASRRASRRRSPPTPACAERASAGCRPGRVHRSRFRVPPHESRSAHRRIGPAPTWARSRSARSSGCPRPGTKRSVHGTRSPSAAWRCLQPPRRPIASVISDRRCTRARSCRSSPCKARDSAARGASPRSSR